MIGWYVHHVGRGHVHRAAAVSRLLRAEVVGLSSLPRPDGWTGRWVVLPRDDTSCRDATAHGQLHWAPLHDDGLRDRMAALSAWFQEGRPDLLVSDVSAEVTLLARLHGVPVVSVVLPGDRSDPTHVLAYRVSDAVVATWPATARDVVRGLPHDVRSRLQHVGGLSRHPVSPARPTRNEPPQVVVLAGAGGTTLRPEALAVARAETPAWTWRVLGPRPVGTWVTDPSAALRTADVVVTHAGQSAVAEVAAARRPAVVIPEPRPYAEQEATARALATGRWPVTVLPRWPERGWPGLLSRAGARDGSLWETWCDGGAARRFAAVLEQTASRVGGRRSAA